MQQVKCRNPECGNSITPYRRRSNHSGRQEYCSLKCYSKYSPRFFEVYEQVREQFGLPIGLTKESAIAAVERLFSVAGTLTRMGQMVRVSRSTIRNWVKKFAVPLREVSLIEKVIRPRCVVKLADLKKGDKVCRIVDVMHKVFLVEDVQRAGVVLTPEGHPDKRIFIHVRLFKIWRKIDGE